MEDFIEGRKVTETYKNGVRTIIIEGCAIVKIDGQHVYLKYDNIGETYNEYDLLSLALDIKEEDDFDIFIRFLDHIVPVGNNTYFRLRCMLKENRVAWEHQTTRSYNFSKTKTYLMTDLRTGHTKIGRSVHPKNRERTLQSEKPSIKLFRVCDKLVESELHKKYQDKRVRGEWFNLSDKDIEEISRDYKFYDHE